MSRGASGSALTKRLAKKLNRSPYHFNLSMKEVNAIKRAFVEALKEEVEARYEASRSVMVKRNQQPLVISGLGSFKMRTRPAKEFANPSFREEQAAGGPGEGDNELSPTVTKPPSRRLVFTSKWEPLP
jgi:nucleoid DNA-binding protein